MIRAANETEQFNRGSNNIYGETVYVDDNVSVKRVCSVEDIIKSSTRTWWCLIRDEVLSRHILSICKSIHFMQTNSSIRSGFNKLAILQLNSGITLIKNSHGDILNFRHRDIRGDVMKSYYDSDLYKKYIDLYSNITLVETTTK